MNNFINYYYNIRINNLEYKQKYYTFTYQNNLYWLYILDENINSNFLIDIEKRLLGNTLINEIIMNKDHQIISKYNNQNYILMKIYININKKITLDEISYFDHLLYTNKNKVNWSILWSKKIDYLEKLIFENEKKYPLISTSFNYFIGLAENAISYYNTIQIPSNYPQYLSHKKISINDTIEAIYNPLNIIFDYQVRDIAEYIKVSFFKNNNIFNELNIYLNKYSLSLTDIKLLISRLLYPSFYFDLLEDILIYNKDEKSIIKITETLPKYEKYLTNIIDYFKHWYDIEEILWLKEKRS